MFLGGSQLDPWCSAGVGHLERGQKHPDFRPKQSSRKSRPESSEGVGGYERRLAGEGALLWLMTSHEGDEFESFMPRSFQNSGTIDVQGSGGGRMVTQVWDVDISGLEATPDIPYKGVAGR